ncbi:GNAT family N-acetyltransferase [Leuconostoc sp. C2]|uniref:GNAT family N-acetyltransferase n=1 Tax=Leuconostoc sp. (strain C2) TaxID=979982 RepID=UPI0002174E60|nr:GNAT family N-acetyltransferase [Leuconostoc sp. C2]AEJ31726.1 histone acetyltransferase HPA2-like acetyltransferase [Leuconostoc sp. C2]
MINIRSYNQNDVVDVVNIFNNAIQAINKKDYTQAQLNEWLQPNPDYQQWNKRLLTSTTYVALTNTHHVIGFINYLPNNQTIDCLFIHPDYINQKVAFKLLQTVLRDASYPIFVYASITAISFFKNNGFSIEKKIENKRNGETLINFKMAKYAITK